MGLGPEAAEGRGDQRPDLDPALGQQFFDVADAQGEPKIEPNRMLDTLRRKAVTHERDRLGQKHLQIGLTGQTGDLLSSDCQHPHTPESVLDRNCFNPGAAATRVVASV